MWGVVRESNTVNTVNIDDVGKCWKNIFNHFRGPYTTAGAALQTAVTPELVGAGTDFVAGRYEHMGSNERTPASGMCLCARQGIVEAALRAGGKLGVSDGPQYPGTGDT